VAAKEAAEERSATLERRARSLESDAEAGRRRAAAAEGELEAVRRESARAREECARYRCSP
jgi:hypothetical protein